MWKSSATYRHYRPGSSQRRGDAATFRRQMADFARAELLRDLRHAAHLSRESLAHEVGVSTKTIYSWENGGGIQWHNALKIAAFFHVDPESLVARDPPPAAATPTAGETQLDRIEGKLDQALAALERLDPPGNDKSPPAKPRGSKRKTPSVKAAKRGGAWQPPR